MEENEYYEEEGIEMESDLDDLPLTEAAPVSKMSKIPGLSFGGPPAEGPT